MRINQLTIKSTLDSTDHVVTETPTAGTRRMSGDQLASSIVELVPGLRNSVFRGKALGPEFTQAHWEAVSSGSFKDVMLGDYWNINGITWRIVAFDFFKGVRVFTKSHIVIMPDRPLYNSKFHTSSPTGGLRGSSIWSSLNSTALNSVNGAFSNRAQEHPCMISTNLEENGGTLAPANRIGLPTYLQLFGATPPGTVPVTDLPTGQFPLFQIKPEYARGGDSSFWLHGFKGEYPLHINGDSMLSWTQATHELGVRPYAVIA